MRLLRLDSAQVLLMDEQQHVRWLVRDALHAIGFRKVESCGTLAEVKGFLAYHAPDLIIVDIDADRHDTCRTIQKIRNRRLGNDPFVTVIALTWNPERGAVAAALNAGIDDLVAKPISAHFLRDRVVNLIQNRKEFVVTSTYVGPDRRDDGRRASVNDLPTIKVPNSLRHRATGDSSAAVDDAAVDAAMRSLGLQKVFRLGSDFARVAGELKAGREEAPEKPLGKDLTVQLGALLSEIETTVRRYKFGGVAQIVATTRAAHDDALAPGRTADARQFELLQLQGLSVVAALRESDGTSGLLVSVLDEAAAAVAKRAS